MSKKCTPLWCEAHFEVKMYKTHQVRTTFGSWDVEKVHAVVARSTFRSQKCKKLRGFGALLDVQMWFRVAGARDCSPCHKWAKREGFVACPKTMAGVGHLRRICKDAFSDIFRGRHSTRDMFIRAVRRSGRWFPEKGCILEHQIFRFAEIILRDRCSTSYDLASLFRGRCSTLDRWSGKIAKTHWYEAVSSALNFPVLNQVSQNCFVFDVVNFEHWGSLAELFCFWRCQVQKLRKSRRIDAFWCCQVQKLMKCPKIAATDRHIDR